MTKRSFDLTDPDHFTAGTVGPPGRRVFYLQGREAGEIVTLKAEKEQVAALAEYLATLLARLPAVSERPPEDLALLEPLEAAWDVGTIGVGYDEGRDRIIVVASEATEADEEEGEDDDAGDEDDEEGAEAEGEESAEAIAQALTEALRESAAGEGVAEEAGEPGSEAAAARFAITRAQAAAFVERGRALVRAGRPICPLCSLPKDPGGHVCPRSNGHVVRS